MAMFNSYVKLPESITIEIHQQSCGFQQENNRFLHPASSTARVQMSSYESIGMGGCTPYEHHLPFCLLLALAPFVEW